jgi:SAM-dependent methyltransferase
MKRSRKSKTGSHKLPKELEPGKIRTANGYGVHFTKIWGVVAAFIKFAANNPAWSLDVGCAFGEHDLKAIKQGARIIANDLSKKHLQVLAARVPKELRKNLRTRVGAFPNISLSDNSVGAILAANVLLFMDGKQLERSARKMFKLLQAGGKVFIVTMAPNPSVPEDYDERKKREKWPGLVKDAREYFAPGGPRLPKMIHFLDTKVLSRVFEEAGFEIEKCKYAWGNYDVRLTTLVARKPA